MTGPARFPFAAHCCQVVASDRCLVYFVGTGPMVGITLRLSYLFDRHQDRIVRSEAFKLPSAEPLDPVPHIIDDIGLTIAVSKLATAREPL